MCYISGVEELVKEYAISYGIKIQFGGVQNQIPSPILRTQDRLISKFQKVKSGEMLNLLN